VSGNTTPERVIGSAGEALGRKGGSAPMNGNTALGIVLQPKAGDPEWEGFALALYWLLGSDVPGRCKTDHRSARRLLELHGGYDVDACLALYSEKGGYCDCEVLLNTDSLYAGRRQSDEDELPF
jgi:hypothetical protein